ncbi:MAG: M28 family peptidase [Bacteroidales bacterium]|nr:M28 family peptidase [Bacteroidales bacterium]
MKLFSFHRFFLLICLFFLMILTPHHSYAQSDIVKQINQIITPEFIRQSIDFLASDSLKGRETPSPGLDIASNFIAGKFQSFGLKSIHGSYFQDLSYCNFDLGSGNFISVGHGLDSEKFFLKTDFVPYDFSGSKQIEGEIVFAGYGITAPECHYDDYKNVDVKGKIVLVLRQEPGKEDTSHKIFYGDVFAQHTGIMEKMLQAMKHGAIGMIVVSGPLQYSSLKPRGSPWPSLSRTLPWNILPMGNCKSLTENIPVVQVGESVINTLLGSVDSLKNIQIEIEKEMVPHSFLLKGKTMTMNIVLEAKPIGGKNVIGFLEGSDPILKNQVVVIGAHYDHVGYLREHLANTDSIFNGADDNASGTSGVLAVAKAFAQIPEKPKRSLLFIAFAGEEIGLLGSSTYVRDPIIPLDQTVAMLNLDMISRNNPDSLELIGARQNPDLIKIIRMQNKSTNLILVESKDDHMEGGSDHVNFFNKGIPAIFFFTGLHADYHQVSDEPAKINAQKAARVARLAFLTAWYISNDNHNYPIINPREKDEK